MKLSVGGLTRRLVNEAESVGGLLVNEAECVGGLLVNEAECGWSYQETGQ